MRNLIQFGSILSAAGCVLNFDASTALVQVVEYPPEKATIIEEAMHDIDLFDDTALFMDGLVAIHLVNLINGYENPLPQSVRNQVLETLGIKHKGAFITQTLAKLKTARSWHVSGAPNTCTYFEGVCTSRGQEIDPHKRGRRSTRTPTDFHPLKGNTITREQLVTPAIENLFRSIDSVSLVSRPEVANLKKLSDNSLQELLARIQNELKYR